tara:strand:- start:1307 stop:1567 length:261 start_codon:yes stop_codon:yes gene_type:complete
MATTTNNSEVFQNWSSRVNDILSRLPNTTMTGEPLEYQDDEYQNVMKMLQQCSMNFEDMPIYPINETIANKLIEDEMKGRDDKPSN